MNSSQEEINCLICQDLLNDQVECNVCHKNFCRECVIKWRRLKNECPFKCHKRPWNINLEQNDIEVEDQQQFVRIEITLLRGINQLLIDINQLFQSDPEQELEANIVSYEEGNNDNNEIIDTISFSIPEQNSEDFQNIDEEKDSIKDIQEYRIENISENSECVSFDSIEQFDAEDEINSEEFYQIDEKNNHKQKQSAHSPYMKKIFFGYDEAKIWDETGFVNSTSKKEKMDVGQIMFPQSLLQAFQQTNTMENLIKLQLISLCSKVTQELENHIGVRDKVLAEYIIEMVKSCQTIDDFKQRLKDDDCEFPVDLNYKLFTMIRKMLPKKKEILEATKDVKIEENAHAPSSSLLEKGQQKEVYSKFPALAVPDQDNKREEIDIDLDLMSEGEDFTKKEIKIISDSNSSKSRSRSRQKDKKKKEKKVKKDKKDKKDKTSKKDKKKRKNGSRSLSQGKHNRFTEAEQGKVYDGIVTNVHDYGCFVSLQGFSQRKEGLVHVSEIADKRINNAFEIIQRNQKVKVKVLFVVGTKIKLSMKDIDQKTGHIISREPTDIIAKSAEIKTKYFQKGNDIFGALTGVKIDLLDVKKRKNKKRVQDENEMWELSRLKYNQHLGVVDNDSEDDLQSCSDGDDVEIEITEKEPQFLRGQTTKAGIILSPVKVVRNPEGCLNREAINALQYARERKENREQQRRAVVEQINKQEISKNWDDPNAVSRTLADQLKQVSMQQMESDQFQKDALFKQSRNYHRSLLTLKEQKESLPIYEFKPALIRAIKNNRVLIVIGETGSGKTTQMTQFLLEAGYAKRGKKICCTQPRRVAAMSVAKRVGEEMGVVLGEVVGYSIRFEDCTSNQTIIKYCTDGMLLRESLLDPDLNQYSVIMLDEAHERNVNTDILFGLLKRVVQKREDFTLIVTSATLDAEKFSSYFFDCNIFRIPGRTFPVEILYSTEAEADYLDAALIVVLQIHLHEPAGDILLFLTGQEEIDNACQTLFERMKKLGPDAPELIILPIYSSLPSELQQRIFLPTPKGSRKVVIATNIAEASITIDGIFYVIDPGFCKLKMFNPNLGHDVLSVVPISQASARQRAGRAGRTGPGKCYRLYTEDAYKNEMLSSSVPEIQRTNLTSTVLNLKAMGINDLLNFDFMDPPPVQTLINSLEQLYALGALDEDGLLTKVGMKMAEFPLLPSESKMLLTAVDLSCADEICTIIAMLQVHNVFFRPKDKASIADQKRAKFNHPEGDFLTLLTVYEAWKNNNFSNIWCHENYIDGKNMRRAQDVRKQLIQIMERYKLPIKVTGKDQSKIRKAITAGFFFNAAKKDNNEGYKTVVDSHTVYIHPSSALFNRQPQWVVYSELVLTSKEYMRNVCVIEPKWLIDVSPNFFQYSNNQQLSAKKRAERLTPLTVKPGQDADAWRMSKRRQDAMEATQLN